MKNITLSGVLLSCMLLSVTGCSFGAKVTVAAETSAQTAVSSEVKPAEDMAEYDCYEKLVAGARDFILNYDGTIPENCDFSSALITAGGDQVLGYLIEDIDGDGTAELIFGGNETEPETGWDGVIYNVYTISDGEPVQLINGWERNRYYLCENGMIANEGSSGAADSSYSYFSFDGSELHLVESVIYDGMWAADNPWFYSTESESDGENADPFSEEEAMEIMNRYTYRHPKFIPFMENN